MAIFVYPPENVCSSSPIARGCPERASLDECLTSFPGMIARAEPDLWELFDFHSSSRRCLAEVGMPHRRSSGLNRLIRSKHPMFNPGVKESRFAEGVVVGWLECWQGK